MEGPGAAGRRALGGAAWGNGWPMVGFLRWILGGKVSSVAWRHLGGEASISLALRREGQAGGDCLGVRALESKGHHAMEGVGEGRDRAREERSPGRNRPIPGRGGTRAPLRRENQGAAGRPPVRPGLEGRGPCGRWWRDGAPSLLPG